MSNKASTVSFSRKPKVNNVNKLFPERDAVKKSALVRKMIFSKKVSDKFKKACKLKLKVKELLCEADCLIRQEKESYFNVVGSDEPIFIDEDLNEAIVFFNKNLDDSTPADWDYRISISVERTINKEDKL